MRRRGQCKRAATHLRMKVRRRSLTILLNKGEMIMKRARQIIASMLVVSFTALQVTAQVTSGQRPRASGSSDYQSEQLIRRVELGAERFRMSLDDAAGQ